MGTVQIGDCCLTVSGDAISFGGDPALPAGDVEWITVDRSDRYSGYIWVDGTRSVDIRGKRDTVHVDFRLRKSSDRAAVDALFDKVFEEVWPVAGARLVARAMDRVAGGETVSLAGLRLSRDGIGWRGRGGCCGSGPSRGSCPGPA